MSAHHDDLASVTAANHDRLMGVAAAISTITNSENTMIDLADLEAKARAATQGEWDIFENLGQDEAWCDWHRVGPFDMTGGKASADDLFIQAAQPRVVLELIERVRAAEAKAVEAAAIAHCASQGFDQTDLMPNDGPRLGYYVPGAQAAITAYLASMQEQGWVMVPKTPSEEMLIRGGNKYDDPYSAMQEDVIAAGLVYRAMIDAAMLEAAKDGQP